jgi:tellurite methyltransferase
LNLVSDQFGEIDIYLFDQLLRGRILPGMRILDAGCGFGRNLVYFLKAGYEVFGADSDPLAIQDTRRLTGFLAPALPATNFRVEAVEAMTFPDAFSDVVLSSAVLHFARDEDHFHRMVREMWRVLTPGGMLFSRLASSIALKHKHVKGRRFISPDGAERFLVDDAFLLEITDQLGGQLLDPLKTTVIQDQRCMTTWIVRKSIFYRP